MKPSHVRRVLQQTLPAGLNVMLVGAPGVGKTSILQQTAAEIEMDVVTIYAALQDPTEPGGVLWPGDSGARYIFSPEMYRLFETERPTVAFLDDFGQAPAATQAAWMQWTLAREVHGKRIADNVTFAIGTNRRQDRAGVTGVLEPVKSRFACILHVEPDLEDLRAWWMSSGLPVNPIAFVSLRWELMISNDAPTADMQNRPNPRTLEHLARLEMLDLPASVRADALAGAAGEGFAIEYLAFCTQLRNMISIDEMLLDPTHAPLPDGPAQLYATAIGISHRADVSNFDHCAIYLTRLYEAGHGEFVVLAVRDSVRRNRALLSTAGCQKMFMGPMRELAFGGDD